MKRVVRTFLKNDDWKYLLVKHHKKWNWVLPWWHIEKWETIYQTLKREIKEELWLDIKIIWDKVWLTKLDYLEEKPLPICVYTLKYTNRDWKDIKKLEYIFLSEIKSWELKKQNCEIYDYKLFTKEELLEDKTVYVQTKEIIEKIL